jgi:hypothetical protein
MARQNHDLLPFVLRCGAAITAFTVAAFTSTGAQANTAISSEVVPAGLGRPAQVPADYVITPHGYFHPTCVVEIKEDEFLDAEDNIVSLDGATRPLPLCLFSHFHPDGREVLPLFSRPLGPQPPIIDHSWVADVQSSSSGPPSSWISANWTVPNNPTNIGSQVIYFFPGLVPGSTDDTILQPVLGWNQGISGWSIASWNCCRGGNMLHSAITPVAPGTNLYGYVWGTNCNAQTGVCASWQVFTSAANGPQTTLNTDSYAEVLNWDFAGALEVYTVATCDQYPPDDGLTFSSVTVHDINGGNYQPAWSTALFNVAPACGRNASFTSTTATITWSHTCTAECGGNCVNLATDVNNCGTCGHACLIGANPSCVSGVCSPCAAGYNACCHGQICTTGVCPPTCAPP